MRGRVASGRLRIWCSALATGNPGRVKWRVLLVCCAARVGEAMKKSLDRWVYLLEEMAEGFIDPASDWNKRPGRADKISLCWDYGR